MDEAALIQAAKAGDLDAFNRLVLAYQDAVYNVAYYLMGDPDQAADATQDAFLSAYRKIKSLRGNAFRAWVLRIVTNACYDELRRQKRRRTTSLEPMTASGDEMESPDWLRDPSESPEASVERSEIRQALRHCMENLPTHLRMVVVLVDVQGMSYAEAAEVIARPVGTVRSRLSRARFQLQRCLQAFRELLPGPFRLVQENDL